jgi:hypothetical protein
MPKRELSQAQKGAKSEDNGCCIGLFIIGSVFGLLFLLVGIAIVTGTI